ncbi:MAG: hypothetical protein QM723_03665 [Myxococcaceae bacterium]
MDHQLLTDLGLAVEERDGVVEAQVEIDPVLWNPVSKKPIPNVRFQVVGERLIAIHPPEFVGITPISVAHLSAASRIDELMVKAFNDHCAHVVRRSAELSSLGFAPKVEPATLSLTADVVNGDFSFKIGTDRNGVFRVVRAARDGSEFTVPGNQSFELNEFKEKSALESYLAALFSEQGGPAPVAFPPLEGSIPYAALLSAFEGAVLPPRSTLEVLAELQVGEDQYRFAAARVQGNTFRGLLAGPKGKVWAQRFELGEFPGLKKLAAQVLEVDEATVKVRGIE